MDNMQKKTRSESLGLLGFFFSHLAKHKEKQEVLLVTVLYPSEALNLSTEI